MHCHDAGCFMHTFPFFRFVQWYPLAFHASLHACLHVYAWVLIASVLSILQQNEAMDTQSKPTFVSRGHPLLFAILLVYLLLVVSFLVFLPPHLFARILVSMLDMSITPICFMPFPTFSALFPSIVYLLVSCLCLYTYTHGVRTHGARAWFPKRKQKGAGASMSI